MKSSKKKTNDFLVMWCNEGLECIIDLNRWQQEHDLWEKKKVWDVLQGSQFRDIEPRLPLQLMILRAQVNPQRNYEIYTISTEKSITQSDMKKMFEDSPQMIVDLIRERGEKIFSGHNPNQKSKIVIR